MSGIIDRLAKTAQLVDETYFERQHGSGSGPLTYIAGPIPEYLIRQAEQQLRLQFPDEYRVFLSNYGAMNSGGFQLAGLTPYVVTGMPFFVDVVAATRPIQRHAEDSTHRHIWLSSDGMGVDFLLEASDAASCRIVGYGAGFDFIHMANGLDDFCRGMMADTYASRRNAHVNERSRLR